MTKTPAPPTTRTRVSATAPIKWGILGTGEIAGVFTAELGLLPDHQVIAVGSRKKSRAEAFGAAHRIPRTYGSYAELAADSELDVVYVATPHNVHYDAAALCIEAGRGVLVEKPFTVTVTDATALVALARAKGLFAMEAMWTRFNPLVRRLRGLVRDGAIGAVRGLYADFSFVAPYDPSSRLWSPALAGGALLDLGVYPLSFAWMLLGGPDAVHATTTRASTGVDANTGIMLRYGPHSGFGGAVALLHCGLMADSPQTATVMGAAGRIEVSTPFYAPTALTWRPYDGADPRTWTATWPGRGYTYQAEEVARCLRSGLTESPDMPLDETVAILRLVDTVRERLREDRAAGAEGSAQGLVEVDLPRQSEPRRAGPALPADTTP